MTKYREIIRLASLNLSQTNIALSCGVSKKTVNKVLKAAREQNISWPLDADQTDPVIEQLLFPKPNGKQAHTNKRMPDYAHIRKELLRNGVNKKLLWTEYLEECRLAGDEPLIPAQKNIWNLSMTGFMNIFYSSRSSMQMKRHDRCSKRTIRCRNPSLIYGCTPAVHLKNTLL